MAIISPTDRPQARIRVVDLNRLRRYLAGVESLAREARITRDPRVLMMALQVLRLSPKTIAEFDERSSGLRGHTA